MSSESQRRFWCNFCCTSNTNAAECFAITHLIILGIAEFFMFYGIGSTGISNISWHMAFWPMLGFFTYWFILSILVVIGTNGKHHLLHLVNAVLGMLGILGFTAYLYIYYGYYNNLRHWSPVYGVPWELTFGCVQLLVSFWYVLCMFRAMVEAKNGKTYTPGIASGVELGQPLSKQQTGNITVPTISFISTERQQVCPTPGSLEMKQSIFYMQPKCDFEPPSYCELFPQMPHLSK